ncbi:endo alpha-1,4 polygalactosaminidase [Streptosporangium sp. G11]|uniref:endo alpha-1,4 polygalactosaminidase n=1 Tax=Streptosporangium sp. G11 TaxID=3436926 RepID=UPI003EB71361
MAIASRRILALALGAAITAGGIIATHTAQASTTSSSDAVVPSTAAVSPPTPNAVFDYQIGGAYDNPAAKVVSRDRQDEADPDLYNICYVNAFQTQPIASEVQDWRNRGLTLKNAQGEEVIDGEWREILLDITTDAKRRAVASVVNGWIDGCADAGYQAVEPDNLDAFDRSEGLIDVQDTVAYLRLLIEHAHSRGLAIAQKNALGDPEDGGIGSAGRDAGLDFAVVEECGRWKECPGYQELYGDNMVVIEYTATGYNNACATVGAKVAVVRRDMAVTPNGTFRAC